MITDANSRAMLQAGWQGVIPMRERMRRLVVSTLAFDVMKSPFFGDILYNLLFVLGFEVLKQAPLEAKDEGLFTESRHQLIDLLEYAKTALPWIDWQGLQEAVKRPNEVTQVGKLFGGTC